MNTQSRYAIIDVETLNVLNLQETSHTDTSTIKHSRDGLQVILEFPPGSIYYDADFSISRDEALEQTRGDNWGCPPEICGI